MATVTGTTPTTSDRDQTAPPDDRRVERSARDPARHLGRADPVRRAVLPLRVRQLPDLALHLRAAVALHRSRRGRGDRRPDAAAQLAPLERPARRAGWPLRPAPGSRSVPRVSLLWHHAGDPIGAPMGGHTRQALEWLGYFTALGVPIAALAAFAMGRYFSRPRVVEEAAVAADDAVVADEAAAAHRGAPVAERDAPVAERDGTVAEPVARSLSVMARSLSLMARSLSAMRPSPSATRRSPRRLPVSRWRPAQRSRSPPAKTSPSPHASRLRARDEPLAPREPVAADERRPRRRGRGAGGAARRTDCRQ